MLLANINNFITWLEKISLFFDDNFTLISGGCFCFMLFFVALFPYEDIATKKDNTAIAPTNLHPNHTVNVVLSSNFNPDSLFIVTDPKGELTETVEKAARENGYEVKIIYLKEEKNETA